MVIQGFRPQLGGAEIQLERLLPRLAARGVEVTVVTRGRAGAPRRERVGGADVLRTRPAHGSPLAAAGFVLGATWHLARRRGELDVVHAHGAFSEGVVALAARALGLPALVKILRAGYEGDFAVLVRRPGGRLRTRLLARHVHFVALSRESEDELLGLGVAAGRIHRIPNGVDVATFRPARGDERELLRRELGLPDGPLVLYAGRLDPVKELDTVLRALAALPSQRLVVAGEGPERDRLAALAHELGVGDRVRFLGRSERLADLLRAADVFVLPSRAEGMSNALLEAMASGLACVASPVSGTSELLADDRGVLADPGDAEAWAARLEALADDPGRRAALGRAAAEHVRARLSLETTADLLVQAYAELART